MSLSINRKVARIAAIPAAMILALFTASNMASANPDDGYSEETEVVVTSVPTPADDTSDETSDDEVVTTDVETTDEETSDGDYETGETSYSTETIYPDIPDYEEPEGEWTGDDGYDHTEYPTTTDCPETTIEYPDDEYDDEEEDDCCDERGDDTDVDVDEGDEVIVDNNNDNYNNNEQSQYNNQEQNVVVVGGGGGGGDLGGVEVNVPVDITIDGAPVTVTKVTVTNVLNETTVVTPGGNKIVIHPDGNGGYTTVPQGVVKEVSGEDSPTGHNPVSVANVSSSRPLEWGVGGSLTGLVVLGGTAYLVSARRKTANNDAGRS